MTNIVIATQPLRAYFPEVTLAIILLIVGLVLLFAEILLPGMVLGALALLSIGGSVAAAYMNTEYGHLFLAIALASIVGFTFWFVLVFPTTKFAKKLTSQTSVGDLGIDYSTLLEQQGEAYTDLRPSGKANINDQRFDVVTEGFFWKKAIPSGSSPLRGNALSSEKHNLNSQK